MVICFGNFPRLFKLLGRNVVFLQNRYLVDAAGLDDFTFNNRARLSIERLWFSARMSDTNEFIVQTPTMKMLLSTRIRGRHLLQSRLYLSWLNIRDMLET